MPQPHFRHIFGTADTHHNGEPVPTVWHFSQWDAQIYAVVVGLGVPLLGYLLPYDSYPMWIIAGLFFALTHLYWYIELREIIVPYEVFDAVNRAAADHQRSEMQSIYWGWFLAVLFWVVPLIFWGLTYWAYNDPRWVGPHYGWAHALILVHTFLVARYSIKTIYAILSIIMELQAKLLRKEEAGHT